MASSCVIAAHHFGVYISYEEFFHHRRISFLYPTLQGLSSTKVVGQLNFYLINLKHPARKTLLKFPQTRPRSTQKSLVYEQAYRLGFFISGHPTKCVAAIRTVRRTSLSQHSAPKTASPEPISRTHNLDNTTQQHLREIVRITLFKATSCQLPDTSYTAERNIDCHSKHLLQGSPIQPKYHQWRTMILIS